MGDYNPDDAVDAVALAWLRERPGTPVEGIGIVTRLWMCAKLLGEDRRRVLASAGADTATLDLLSVLRRSGEPYQLTTRQITEQTGVTAGAISQRLARAENAGLVERSASEGSRIVLVTLTAADFDGRLVVVKDWSCGKTMDLRMLVSKEDGFVFLSEVPASMRAGRVERDSFGKTYRDLARGTILGNRRALEWIATGRAARRSNAAA